MENARPQFSGKKKVAAYYSIVNGIVEVLRPRSSLRVIADHLNSQGLLTPTDRIWTRERVAGYIRNAKLANVKEKE